MDPVLGSVLAAALAALIAGLFAIRQTRILESERAKAAANTADIESTRVVFDGVFRLEEAHTREIVRLEAKVAALQETVDYCREHHTTNQERA